MVKIKTQVKNANTILKETLDDSFTLNKENTGTKFAKKVKKILQNKNVPNEEINVWYNLFNIPQANRW